MISLISQILFEITRKRTVLLGPQFDTGVN